MKLEYDECIYILQLYAVKTSRRLPTVTYMQLIEYKITHVAQFLRPDVI